MHGLTGERLPMSRTDAPVLALFALGVVVAACLLAGCGGARHTSASALGVGPRDRWGTVWLCRPGERDNPCLSALTTTVVEPDGATTIERLGPAAGAPIDCFYVYPTISAEPTINADLSIGFREREVAVAQAARFSQVCRVYAPVYRQLTLSALEHPGRITRRNALIAYGSVVAAFHSYLAHYNQGRGIVFIGHSQGAAILTELLRRDVDNVPALRQRLVSALLLGGNVTVADGQRTGGDFKHIPACTSSQQSGCVVAYSSFVGAPPRNSQFGRTSSDAGLKLLAPQDRSPGLRIMCVNPASPGAGSGRLDPALPSLVLALLAVKGIPPVSTAWAALPGRFTARCKSSGNATWLQVSATAGRPSLLTHLRDPALGLHVLDLTIALDNLVHLAGEQARAYTALAAHRRP
jgi:hypothetical protein